MAKTSSARKALRVSKRQGLYNARRKGAMKTAVKSIGKLITSKSADAAKSLAGVQQAIDKAAKNGTIKKNTAARMKSRIAKRISALSK
jgi:small subunit ribosomal protein S20